MQLHESYNSCADPEGVRTQTSEKSQILKVSTGISNLTPPHTHTGVGGGGGGGGGTLDIFIYT